MSNDVVEERKSFIDPLKIDEMGKAEIWAKYEAEIARLSHGWQESFRIGVHHQERANALEEAISALKAELRKLCKP